MSYIQVFAQTALTNYQYWFDNDFSNVQTGMITGNLFNQSINTSGLNSGSHTFHFRTKQNNNTWSVVMSQPFIIPSKLVEIEYWFDQDFNSKIQETISAVSIQYINSILDANALTAGKHTINYRFKNSNGKWSSLVTQHFMKSPNRIDAYEYWFDDNYGSKNLITLSNPVKNLTLDTLISSLAIFGNSHSISIRFHQLNGTWSSTSTQLLKKTNHIIAYEYWFNNDYATKTVQAISPIHELELTPTINASATPLGSNTVFIRFKDEYGKWSQILTEGFCHNTGDSSIHLKLFVQGYYSGNGMMASVLFNEGVSNDMTITDSIDVELHSSTSPYEMLSSIRTSLNTDGTAKCDFPWNFIGSYYLAVKHRNLVETWTSYPIFRGNCPSEYDFTLSNSKAFGDNMIEVESGVWAMYSGDINQDQNTDLLDILFLENDINNFQYGYIHTDLNGDGNVDLLDMPALEGNVNNFVFALHP